MIVGDAADRIDRRLSASAPRSPAERTRGGPALGLQACTAVLALLGVLLAIASGASAAPGHFTANFYPSHLQGTPIKGKANSITASGTTTECSSSLFTGDLTAKATELTLEPSFTGCLRGAEPQTITWNGCDYVFRSGEGTESEFPVTVDLKCPIGKQIEVHGYASATKHGEVVSNCTFTVGGQTGLKGLTYTKEPGTNSFILEGTIEQIAYQIHGACSFGLTINEKMSQHVNTTVQATGPIGHFTADAYPAHLDGSTLKGKVVAFTDSGATYECSSMTYTGDLTGKATEVTLEPSFSGCLKGAEPQTITWNGCDYVFNAEEGTEAEFSASVDLECPGTNRVEIHTYASVQKHNEGISSCTLTISEQADLQGVTYTKEPETDSFILEGAIEGLVRQAHGDCSFGFTINNEMTQHVNATVLATN